MNMLLPSVPSCKGKLKTILEAQDIPSLSHSKLNFASTVPENYGPSSLIIITTRSWFRTSPLEEDQNPRPKHKDGPV